MATLIKIDRNGSKYYEGIVKCDRCDGKGGADAWQYTGWTCYKCGGTGMVTETWIERTPEYQAKLDARRAARNAKRMAEAEAENAKREAERLAREAEEERKAREEAERKARSQFVGVVGEKLTVTAKYLGSPYFTTHMGWMEKTIYVHNFEDEAGDKLVWKSESFRFDAEEGDTVTLTGIVKDHSEYKGEKQTVLTRCKVQ